MLTQEQVASIVADMQAEIATTALRDEPIGYDRHHRRYFLLGTYVEQTAQHPGLLVVEVPQGPRFGGPPFGGAPAHDRLATQTLQWYDSVASLDALLAWLNPSGPREGPLRERVAAYRAALVDAVGTEQGALTASVAGMLTPGDVPMEEDAAVPLADVVMADTEEPAAPDVQAAAQWAPRTLQAELQADKDAVLALLDAMPGESFDLTKATPQLLEAVRAGVSNAPSWDVLMAALIVVEESLLSGCFKPWWRLWALTPGYVEESKGTMGPGPLRLRLAMLQAALRRAPAAATSGRSTRGAGAAAAAVPRAGGRRATRQVCSCPATYVCGLL